MASSAGHIRPGRYLWVFALIVVALYALVFGTPDHKAQPELGIDLSGGTTVTLTARTQNGQPPSQSQMQEAQQNLQSRVDGIGVAGATVQISGNDNIIITAPGDQSSLLKTIGQTAKLVLRPVLNTAAASPTIAPATTAPSTPPTSGSKAPTTAPSTGATKNNGMGAPGQSSGGLSPQAYVAATPTTAPTPPSGTATPPPSGSESLAQQQAQQIAAAKATRQSTDTTIQQAALNALTCGKNVQDPLVDEDNPALPLVTCSTDFASKYILSPSILDGTQINSATAQQDPDGTGDFVVEVTFKSAGTKTWAAYTAANVGKQIAVVLDSQVVEASTIQSAIPGGNTQINGQFTQQQATDLANVLQYGSLPLAFVTSNAQTVSATLGSASLIAGLVAGGLGLLLVVVYCLFYYRALGVLTVLSLGLSGACLFGLLVLLGRWVGYSLSLAGIAGFIIAIGVTADSFVVFFERLKDEVREGRTFRSAVPRAWVRARRTILASDAVQIIAAVVLYIVAVSDVQGFAFTLGLSTVLDLLIVFLVTHPLVVLASRSKFLSKPSMSGLGAVQRAGAAIRARKAAAAGVKEA